MPKQPESAQINKADPASTEAQANNVTRRPNTAVGGTFRSLRHRNFQLYFSGQLISVAGTWMQAVAQAWLVYEISHSDLTLGIVGFAAGVRPPHMLVLG